MATCQTCGYKWSWKDNFRKMFAFRRAMKCPNCQHTQYASFKSMQKMSLLGLIPSFVWIVFPLFGVSDGYISAITSIVVILGILSMPFLLKLSNKEEAPFD